MSSRKSKYVKGMTIGKGWKVVKVFRYPSVGRKGVFICPSCSSEVVMFTANCHKQKKCKHCKISKLTYVKSRANGIIQNARARRVPVLLSKEQIIQMIQEPCYYCGYAGELRSIYDYPSIKTKRALNPKYKAQTYARCNGLDQIIPGKGYSKTNSVTCCGSCNSMKKDFSPSAWVSTLEKISKRLSKLKKDRRFKSNLGKERLRFK